MSIFTDPNREVIYRVLELLPTIEQALQHMQLQLDELRLEESALLFKDVAEAMRSIAQSILPILTEARDTHLLQSMTDIRKSIMLMTDAYEENNLKAIQFALNHRFVPAFDCWQKELEQILRPSVIS